MASSEAAFTLDLGTAFEENYFDHFYILDVYAFAHQYEGSIILLCT
jgi:hypothetical protein